ncbi:MAG: fumarate hydratase C-terminal domain-containing protein [Chitinispirillaceae bacterium]|nr:fumarate hydratase C-terminal domain-containing protein [Chitinispirillaceae bacterium]
MCSLTIPVASSEILSLENGEQVLLTGKLYTARDAAHKRLIELIDTNNPPPVDLKGQFLYYTGPTPPKPGEVIGSAGPTTSSRMDGYTPKLIAASGLRGIIGKGNRGFAVIEALKKHGCVYFAATGGAGALLGKCVTKARVVCYEDLGPEAIYELEVVDFPAVVAIDVRGGNMYVDGPEEWRERRVGGRG